MERNRDTHELDNPDSTQPATRPRQRHESTLTYELRRGSRTALQLAAALTHVGRARCQPSFPPCANTANLSRRPVELRFHERVEEVLEWRRARREHRAGTKRDVDRLRHELLKASSAQDAPPRPQSSAGTAIIGAAGYAFARTRIRCRLRERRRNHIHACPREARELVQH
jgi:hypothetical protein